MAQATTIKLHERTKARLEELKGSRSFDELVNMLIDLVPAGDEEGEFTPELRKSLLEGLLYKGPTLSMDKVRSELGLE